MGICFYAERTPMGYRRQVEARSLHPGFPDLTRVLRRADGRFPGHGDTGLVNPGPPALRVVCRPMTPNDDVGATVEAATAEDATWLARLERGLDQLIHVSHVASPDELPGMVA